MKLIAGKREALVEGAASLIIFIGVPFIAVVSGAAAIRLGINIFAIGYSPNRLNELPALLAALCFSGSVSIFCIGAMWSFARFCYAKKIIFQLPRLRNGWDESVPQRLDRLVIEVLRQNIGSVDDGFIPYPLQEKFGGVAVRLMPRAWEHGEILDPLKQAVKLPEIPYLSVLEKIEHIDPLTGWAAFSNGIVIGWQRTFWDIFFALGPRYIVVFPSWACVCTHADGFYVQQQSSS